MNSPPRILIVYAHPTHRYSKVNRRLADAARSVPNVLLQDLYETYPDFYIDVEHEQQLLANANLIVFQHPIQWYSMPSLLKEWIDVVFEDGWAYGRGGTALLGKDFWLVATTGGPHESYQESGYHGHTFSAFLPPIEQTIALCGMRWLPPLILHGAHDVEDTVVAAHVEKYRQRLASYPDWPELRTAHAERIVKRS
jgi:glutathione-regulated potassium-efflux system ancillary protein KefF